MYAENTGQIEEFLTILKKRKWQIVLPAVFILALSIVLALIIPGKYLVEGKFELRHVRIEKDRGGRDTGATSTGREVENVEDHLKSFRRIQEVITKLGWDEYANLKNPTLRKEYIKSQMRSLHAVTPNTAKQRQSAFVDVTYLHVNPRKGENFLDALVNTWARDLSARDEDLLADEMDGLQNEVVNSQRIYRDSLNRKERIEKEMELVAWNPPGTQSTAVAQDPYTVELTGVMVKLTDAETEKAGWAGQLNVIRERIPQMEDFVNKDVSSEPTNREGRIAAIETQISQLRSSQSGLTPLHSTYKRIQRAIGKLEGDLRLLSDSPEVVVMRSERVPNLEKQQLEKDAKLLEVQLRGVDGKITKLSNREKELQAIMAKRISLSREHEEVQNEVKMNRDLYNDAVKDVRVKENQLAELVRANRQPFQWTQRPFAPPDPTEPNPLLIIAIGLVGGLAIGLGSSVLMEFSKNCYRNVGDVTAVMTLPVLGVVNEIITSQQRRATRFRGAVMVSSSLVMLTVIGWFTWAYTRNPDILPTGFLIQIEEFRSSFE